MRTEVSRDKSRIHTSLCSSALRRRVLPARMRTMRKEEAPSERSTVSLFCGQWTRVLRPCRSRAQLAASASTACASTMACLPASETCGLPQDTHMPAAAISCSSQGSFQLASQRVDDRILTVSHAHRRAWPGSAKDISMPKALTGDHAPELPLPLRLRTWGEPWQSTRWRGAMCVRMVAMLRPSLRPS